MDKEESSAKKWDIITFTIGTILVIVGLTLGIMSPFVIDQVFKNQAELRNDSKIYELWLRTPLPMYLELYLFNFTNSAEFKKNSSVIPNLEEIGPFVFLEVHDRVNISWNDNFTVTYNQTRTWHFIPELSLDLSTQVTNLNVITSTVAYQTRFKKWYSKAIDILLNTEGSLFVTKPAREWLFEGMDDKLLNLIIKIENLTGFTIPFKKFGWFFDRNQSSSFDGMFTIKTGVDDIYNLGIMDRWNHMNRTSYFLDNCAMVNGTSGELFPPMKGKQNELSVFISDACSSVSLKYSQSVSVQGINGYQFIGDDSMFDNGDLYPDHKCFCVGECIPTGARNISSCRFGAPAFVSYPHFYLANESYLNAVSGMKPNKSIHEFIAKIDPVTGMPLEVRAQLQVNVLIQPIPFYKMFKNMPKVFIPMLWFRQRAEITSDLAYQAELFHLIRPLFIGVFYSIMVVGIIIILARLYYVVKRRRRRDEDMEPILPQSGENES